MANSDTIFAFSSGEGVSAIAVLRLSGQGCQRVVEAIFGRQLRERHAHVVSFKDPVTTKVLDRGLALWFPAPNSFTGEDCLEFHCHGGLAVKTSIIRSILKIDGCRLAVPGEFTRRAYLNGKMDLTGVEGLGDLLSAKTEMQQYQALGLIGGRLSEAADAWRQQALTAIARVSSVIDFSEEADVDLSYVDEVKAMSIAVAREIRASLKVAGGGEIVREGFKVVLCGAVNVGKSSLLNALARREVAIVSELPGTTRDILEVELDLEGLLVRVSDSAGIRQVSDIIENIGIDRAFRAACDADLVLWIWEFGACNKVAPAIAKCGSEIVSIMSKRDLDDRGIGPNAENRGKWVNAISVQTGYGISELEAFLARKVRERTCAAEQGLVIRERHLSLLVKCCERLESVACSRDLLEPELIAEEFRLAADYLGQITGHIGVEEVLGEVFSRYCIGK